MRCFTALCCVAALIATAVATDEGTLPPVGAGTPQPFFMEVAMHKAGLQQGKHMLPFAAQDGKWHPLMGGAGAQDFYLTNRPRLSPSLTVTVTNDGRISECAVEFGDDAFAVPAFTVSFRDRYNSTAAFVHDAAVRAAEKAHTFTLPEALQVVEHLPPDVAVTLAFAPQYTSSFVATVEQGLPRAVVDSGSMHDLVPHNSTMGMKFVFRVHERVGEKRLMSVWASRKPPLPDFTLILAVDGKVHAQINIESDSNSTDAQGFDVDISPVLDDMFDSPVTFVAHFYEPRREHVAHLRVPNLRSLVKELSGASEATERTLPTTAQKLALRFYARPGSNLGFSVLQPGPMRDLLISMYYLDPATGERTLFLREGDLLVPYSAHHDRQQYSWDDAIPAAVEAMTSDGQDFFDATFEFDIAYNTPQGRWDAGFLLQEWVASYGGDASAVDLGYLGGERHSFHSKHVLKTTRAVEEGQPIVTVPYDTLLTTAHIARNQWIHALENFTAAHSEHVKAKNILPEARKVMEMSAVVMLQLFDESTNFRVLFNSFRASSYKLPVLFSEAELAVFGFDADIAHEVKRMQDLWAVEFDTLASATGRLPRAFDKQDYFHARAQVEMRLINLTEQLVLAPVLDLPTHDEDPSAVLEYDDAQNRAVLVARRKLSPGKAVTLDYGTRFKTKLDFFLQYGNVPMNAISSVTWRFNATHSHSLTTEKASRRAVLDHYAAAAAAGGAVQPEHEEKALARFTLELNDRRAGIEKWDLPAMAKDAMPDLVTLSERLRLALLDVLHHHQGFAAADANEN